MKLFIKDKNCPKCDELKAKMKIPYTGDVHMMDEDFINTDTMAEAAFYDTMAEAAFYDVLSVPTLVIGDKKYTEIEDILEKINEHTSS